MKGSTYRPRRLQLYCSASREHFTAFVCAAALLLSGPTCANSPDITILHAWSRATPKGASVAAGYLTIENRGNTVDRLLSASSPVARKVEIHEMSDASGVMTMRPASDEMVIPPQGKLVLAQGGNHLMFLQLTAPLSEGERIPVSLDFEKAGQIHTSLEVVGVGAKGPPSAATSEEPASGIAGGADLFFTHIHDPRVMANVTVSPARSGSVEVVVQLEDPQESALAADGLSIQLSGSDNGIVLNAIVAERIATDSWRARMFVSEAGRWNLTLRIALTPKERIEITAPILVE